MHLTLEQFAIRTIDTSTQQQKSWTHQLGFRLRSLRGLCPEHRGDPGSLYDS